ncbi:hypothetical protein AB0K89_15195 [Streptomyces cinnamoneus]|uniref:Uncharacterized protein n=1 Tax=Streptomyces cinnamoneus TaxID=53446 RepID=A0A918WLV7_STRCJ|nr:MULTISPECIES: hypothetical protein [Streptomyces]GHC58213.1 hypothetical protein GCM10010507_38770 [Streptomyces cinnamoneus]
METEVLELQELPETDGEMLEPMMCCDTVPRTDWTDGCTEYPRCR